MTKETKTGTHEWADQTINIQTGCEHDCSYCYAKKMAIRFKRASNESWKTPIVDKNKVCKTYHKRYGKIMFPSSHDITPANLTDCIQVISNLLIAGNRILIVTKPHSECIEAICDHIEKHGFLKSSVEFRFTITSITDKISRMYEPGAPSPYQRLDCIELALSYGFSVSISCEPLLEDPEILLFLLDKYKVDDIWIGAMNYCKNAPKLDYLKIFYDAKQYDHVKFKESFRKKLPQVFTAGTILYSDYSFVGKKEESK